ncbi:hypothetical protein BGZ94_005128 [Podila epigama]|nr:hypothetical protein BGZ94_005128 [Podila epigama]
MRFRYACRTSAKKFDPLSLMISEGHPNCIWPIKSIPHLSKGLAGASRCNGATEWSPGFTSWHAEQASTTLRMYALSEGHHILGGSEGVRTGVAKMTQVGVEFDEFVGSFHIRDIRGGVSVYNTIEDVIDYDKLVGYDIVQASVVNTKSEGGSILFLDEQGWW